MDSIALAYNVLVADATTGSQSTASGVVKQERRIVPFLAPPQPPYDLIGRDILLQNLKQRVFDGGGLGLSTLSGLPGVGKTALAVALAHDREVLEHFSDGVLWAGIGRQPDILTRLGEWGLALGIPQAEMEKLTNIEASARAIHAAIGSRRMLLVVDDAWQVQAAQTFKLGGPNCAYLVTTRLPEVASLVTAGEGITEVHELNEEDGLKLLTRLAPEVVRTELDKARELVRAVGGLPLALILMGNYLRVQTLSGQPRRMHNALDRLFKVQERLQLAESRVPLEYHPSLPIGTPLSLLAVIKISDDELHERSREALQALSVFPAKPNTFSEAAALVVANKSVEILDTLVDAGLLESSGLGRYTLHQTISDYARTQLTDMAAYKRMVEFFVSFVEAHVTDYGILEQETTNILAALQKAFEQGMQTAVIRGANAFFPFLQPRGLYTLAEDYLNRAEEAARSLNDILGLARVLLNLGEIAEKRGDYTQAEAYLQEGLMLARQVDHGETIGALLRNLGEVARDRGDYTEAESYLQEGLTLARQVGHLGVISSLLSSLGAVANHRAHYAQAEAYLQEGLIVARQIDHRGRISGILATLGDVLTQWGDYTQAEIYLQEGLAIARQSGHQGIICALLRNLGALARDRGEYIQAEIYLQEGLGIARQIGHRGRISSLLMNLGAVVCDRKDYLQAEEYLQEGLSLARQIGHRENISLLLQNLGNLAIHQGDYAQAEEYLQKGLTIARQIDHRRVISLLLRSLSEAAYDLGNYMQAEAYLQEGLTLAREISHFKLISDILSDLGELSLKQRRLDEASVTFREALEMAQGGNQYLVATALYGLAQVAAAQGSTVMARLYGQASLTIFEAISPSKAAEVREWLASLLTKE